MICNHKTFLKLHPVNVMFYHFELQMAGAILLTAMLIGGITMWVRRKRAQRQLEIQDEFDSITDKDIGKQDKVGAHDM